MMILNKKGTAIRALPAGVVRLAPASEPYLSPRLAGEERSTQKKAFRWRDGSQISS